MGPFGAFLAGLCGALWLAFGGCSLQTLDRARCQARSDCRQLFGQASVCASDGFCSAPQLHPRCMETFPEGLLERGSTHADTIVFGSLFNRDNSAQVARERSIQLAVRQINDEGGIDGRRFGVVLCNTAPTEGDRAGSTAEAALQAADYLVEVLEVSAILGPASSGDVTQVFTAIRDSGVFLISPSATGAGLTALDETEPTDDSPGLLWRTAPPDDELQGRAIAEDMVQRGVDRVRVIAEADPYGEGLSAIFEASFSGDTALALYSNANQLTEAITEAGNSDAQEVLFIASTQSDVVRFLAAAESIRGYGDKGIFLTDTAATDDVLADRSSDLFARVRGTRPTQLTTEDSVFGNFVAAYRTEFDSDVTRFSFTAQAYDMTWVTALGAAWAILQEEPPSGLHIARGARRLSEGDSYNLTPSRWPRILDDFRQGKGVDIRGASGDLDYSPDREEIRAFIDVWTIDTGGDRAELTVDYVFMGDAAEG